MLRLVLASPRRRCSVQQHESASLAGLSSTRVELPLPKKDGERESAKGSRKMKNRCYDGVQGSLHFVGICGLCESKTREEARSTVFNGIQLPSVFLGEVCRDA